TYHAPRRFVLTAHHRTHPNSVSASSRWTQWTTWSAFPAGMTWPLQSGNATHALAAPKLAVSAPKRTVAKARTTATIPTNPGREPGVIGGSVIPGLAPGVRFAGRAATSNVASRSIAVPRCRITVHGGRLSFTVTAPNPT